MKPEKLVISARVFYGTFVILLVFVSAMTGWTISIANTVNSSDRTRTETFQDMFIPYASGVVHADTFAFLYEAAPSHVWFNVSIDFIHENPINVTLEGVTIYEASSTGEFPSNYTIIGQSPITTDIVNASHVHFYGRVVINPVLMAGNVTLGLSVAYWVYTDTQDLHGGWGDLFMFPVTIVPSILGQEGWFYANTITLIIGVILLVRYSVLRIRSSFDLTTCRTGKRSRYRARE